MPIGPTRDDAALTAGLRRWVAACPDQVPGLPDGAAAEVVSIARADGGMANETVLVDLGAHPDVVVRLPPIVDTFPEYDLAPQAVVQNALAAAGVPAPAPAVVVNDEQWIGTSFLAMPRVEGRIPGPAPVFDQWMLSLSDADRRTLHDGFMAALAEVHRVDWVDGGLGAALHTRSLSDELDVWARYVAWAGEGEPLPALIEALEWCRQRLPSDGGHSSVLLWGDARLGNVVFDESLGVHAVLDWDLAGLGPREMDLGWYFGLEFMMEQLFGRRVPGFPSKEDALNDYEVRSGHSVAHLGWHEVFALTRALAINDRHQRIAHDRRRTDNPMASILLTRMEAEG